MRAKSSNRKIVTIAQMFILSDILSAGAAVDAKAFYYLIDDREVTSFSRSGRPHELTNERQNFETFISLTLSIQELSCL